MIFDNQIIKLNFVVYLKFWRILDKFRGSSSLRNLEILINEIHSISNLVTIFISIAEVIGLVEGLSHKENSNLEGI
jgi:hypothetical protein